MPFGRVVGTDDLLEAVRVPVDVAIGVGSPAARRRIALQLRRHHHLRFPNLVHPRAVIDLQAVRLGVGNFVAAGCVFTCDIAVGDFNLFNFNVTVGHDAVVGSYNVINPGTNVSGGVQIGDACLCGTGSQILQRLGVASATVLGAGAVLVRSTTEEGLVLAGVPARPLRSSSSSVPLP
jgi:sugar O-acyltransferase (sialic acid O-acetyltransferase NeuD family)